MDIRHYNVSTHHYLWLKQQDSWNIHNRISSLLNNATSARIQPEITCGSDLTSKEGFSTRFTKILSAAIAALDFHKSLKKILNFYKYPSNIKENVFREILLFLLKYADTE